MTGFDHLNKRLFDFLVSLAGLVLVWPIILAAALTARRSTGESGFFRQTRIGRYGQPFKVIKIRTMRSKAGPSTTVTVEGDPRITPAGAFMRRYKIDELPQLINVLLGQMSFVGPRPDVPGFADQLTGDDRIVLTIRPGITGPATLAYRDEEFMLASSADPEAYNRDVIWPDKVRINKEYIQNYSLLKDLHYILVTLKR